MIYLNRMLRRLVLYLTKKSIVIKLIIFKMHAVICVFLFFLAGLQG